MAVPAKHEPVDGRAEPVVEARAAGEETGWRVSDAGQLHARFLKTSAPTQPRPGGVGHVTEIVEMILQHLHHHDLYVLQRVCKQWRDVINGPGAVARKLLLRKTSPLPAIQLKRTPLQPLCVRLNPLLECRPLGFRELVVAAADNRHLTNALGLRRRIGSIHRLLKTALVAQFRKYSAKYGLRDEKSPWTLRRDGELRGALWGGQVSDPPTAVVYAYVHFIWPSIGALFKVANPCGVTLRDVVESALHDKRTVHVVNAGCLSRRTSYQAANLRKELESMTGSVLSGVEINERESCILLPGCDMVPGCDNDLRRT